MSSHSEQHWQGLTVSYEEATEYFRYRLSTIDWAEYFDYLSSKNTEHYSKVMLSYAQKYGELGFNYKLVLYPESRKKKDIMKAISNLCKFFDVKHNTIVYYKWHEWLRQKEIDWKINTRNNSYQIRKKGISLDKITENINKVEKERYRNFAKYVLVSGLRAGEAIFSWNNHSELCDGKVTELFLDRKTKKANAVYCHPDLHDKIEGKINRSQMTKHISKKHLGCELKYLRKMNYTMISETLKNVQLAKFMQGRTGDVSERLYYLPMMNDNYEEWKKLWNKIMQSCQTD